MSHVDDLGAGLVALDEDHHVHSIFSDDAVSTLAENVRAARERGLRVVVLADHVRQGSAWVPDFVAAVRELRPGPGLEVLAGVEAKILDGAGELDLPRSLRGVDRVLIADHQYPGDHGPVPPAGHAGRAGAPPVLGGGRHRRPDRGHPRGPGAGGPARSWPTCSACCRRWAWTRRTCPARPWTTWPGAARRAGARVEVNEKWACPSPRTIRALAAAGVPLVASTDSHDCADCRAVPTVRELLAAAPASPVP